MNSLRSVLSILFLLNNLLLSRQTCRDTRITIWHKWRYAVFHYPTETEKNEAIAQGQYIPSNVILLDSDYHRKHLLSRMIYIYAPGLAANHSTFKNKLYEILVIQFCFFSFIQPHSCVHSRSRDRKS